MMRDQDRDRWFHVFIGVTALAALAGAAVAIWALIQLVNWVVNQ